MAELGPKEGVYAAFDVVKLQVDRLEPLTAEESVIDGSPILELVIEASFKWRKVRASMPIFVGIRSSR